MYFTVDDPSTIEVVSTVAAINSKVGGIREAMLLLPEVLHVISLDAEWGVVCNAAGHVVGSERVALIQLGYRLGADEQTRALLVRVHDKTQLPERLKALLSDSTCKRCKAWGMVEQGQKCKGRTMKGVGACEHFKQDPPEEECYAESEGEGEEGGGEEQDDE